MTRRPTIMDVARAAGVSPTTVSHSFSGKRRVEPETQARIRDAAALIGYRPSRAAQALRGGRVGIIAIATAVPPAVAAGPSRLGFLMEIAASAAMAAFAHGLTLSLIPPLQPGSHPGEAPLDGVILLEPAQDDPLIAWFESCHVPIVSIGTAPGRPDLPAVDLGSYRTAMLLLDHLRAAGSRRIGLVTGAARRSSHQETERAYADFAAAQGLAPAALRLDEAGGEALAYAAGREFLARHPDLDGLLVPVDAFAAGLLRAAREAGRQVPGDLRIATRYDGLRAKLSDPPLTAVDLHLGDLAGMAVELLLLCLEGQGESRPAPPPRLIIRASTDPGAM